MKKTIALLLSLVLLLALFAGCSKVAPSSGEDEPQTGALAENLPPETEPAKAAEVEKAPEPTAQEPEAQPTPTDAPEEEPAPEPTARELTAEELKALNENLDWNDNGFFVTKYYCPEVIDWDEVFYDGAGLAVTLTDAQRAWYEACVSEIFTDIVAVRDEDVRAFVLAKTGTDYTDAQDPLHWNTHDGLYITQHGDTNRQFIEFERGTVDGDLYRLYYTVDAWWDSLGAMEYCMTAEIKDGAWRYLSNLPADEVAPITLARIEIFDSADGLTDILETRHDEDWPLRWAVITAECDNVRYSLDYRQDGTANTEALAANMRIRLPAENIASGVLMKGEQITVRYDFQSTPVLGFTASTGAWWGDFWFDDGYWSMDPAGVRLVTGHDYDGERRGVNFTTVTELCNFLYEGAWVYLDDAGNMLAGMSVEKYYGMDVYIPDMLEDWVLYIRFSDEPGLITLSKYDPEDPEWSRVSDLASREELGEYQLSAIQLDGEQILILTDTTGDGALGSLLPGASAGTRTFEFVRRLGTMAFEEQG